MTICVALCCGVLALGIEAALAEDVPIPMTAEQIGIRVQQLHAAFDQARGDCGVDGRVPLVISVSTDGWPQFDCVSPDDPSYKGQQTMTDIESRLRRLVGQDIQRVVDRLGRPNPNVNDDPVYTWGSATQYLLHLPPPAGDVLSTDGLIPYCKIKLTVDRETHIIKSYEHMEQRGGCWPYAQKLDREVSP